MCWPQQRARVFGGPEGAVYAGLAALAGTAGAGAGPRADKVSELQRKARVQRGGQLVNAATGEAI